MSAPPEWMDEAAHLRERGPRHLLFLCVQNSARSQMAEGGDGSCVSPLVVTPGFRRKKQTSLTVC